MSIFSKIADTVKGVVKGVAPVAATAANFIPGVGPTGAALIGAGANLVGGYADRRAAQAYNSALGKNWKKQQKRILKMDKRRTKQIGNVQRRSDYKQMRDQYEDQFEWLVEGAQKAGYNPLTVLGRQGTFSGGYGAGAGGASAMPEAANPLTTGQIFANAAKTYAENIPVVDPIEQETRRLNNELTQARINQINSEQLRLGQSVPQVRRTASQVESYDPMGTPAH